MFLVILLVICFACLCASLYGIYRLSNIIRDLEGRIEKSLDVIDVSYGEISNILDMPIFHDDVIIKKVAKTIVNAKNSLLHIANIIALTDKEKSDEENK